MATIGSDFPRVPDSTPVIIGVGQFAEKPDDPSYKAFSPMDLAGRALEAAIMDCRATQNIARHLDTVAAIRQFEISTPRSTAPFGCSNNPPRSISRRVGADPERAILEIAGGQGNQKLVGELAADIAMGRSEMAAIVGSEAISTVLALGVRGEQPDWTEEVVGSLEDRGYGVDGLIEKTFSAHGLIGAIPLYAICENARRAKLGRSVGEYRHDIGALFAPFTAVAAANPFAAAPVRYTAKDLATETERNRLVAEPYLRMTVARDQVNQAAAILLASAGKARQLGIPEERWVYIHAVVAAEELSLLERPDLAESPSSVASVSEAMGMAGIAADDIGYFDLYSCFAIPVFNIIDAINIGPDDSRGLTQTGGLPFFGGAGNNYSAHAIAEVVAKLRVDSTAYALVGANGGIMSKYATGIYSRQPADWINHNRYRKLTNSRRPAKTNEDFEGLGVIQSYTIVPGRNERHGVIVGQGEGGAKFVAKAELSDAAALGCLESGVPFGRPIKVLKGASGGNIFSLESA